MHWIYHIADIHIHAKNYNHIAFSWKCLIQDICSKPNYKSNSILVIAGDIFDHKTYLKADDIKLFNEIINSLESNEIQAIIIPGNHDFNNNLLSADNHGDMLHALIDNENKKKFQFINYFPKSCVFLVQDQLAFFIHSPIDLEMPKPISPLHDKYVKIAIAHESLKESKTVSGHTLGLSRLSVDDFATFFDFTMLGDVHQTQVFGSKKNVAYSGSFVQKDRSEGLLHGYYLWNVQKKEPPVFHCLPQLSLWVRMYAQNNIALVNEDLEKFLVPTEIKIRGMQLYHTNCNDVWLKDYKDSLEKRFKCKLDGVYNNDYLAILIKEEESKQEKLNGNDIEHLIETDLNRYENATIEQKKRVIVLHRDLFEAAKLTPDNNYWIKFLSWSGLYTYEQDSTSYINFDDLHNLTSLLGTNNAGKSAILDILSLVLFNCVSKGSKKCVVNLENPNKEAWCKCILEVGQDLIIIERAWFGKDHQSKIKLTKNNENITKTTLLETYKFLEETVTGSYRIFKDSVFALQGRQSIVDFDKNECYELFCKIVDLDRLKIAEKENHLAVNHCKKQLNLTSSCFTSYEMNELKLKLEQKQKDLVVKQTQLKIDTLLVDKMNEEIDKLQPIAYSCFMSLYDITNRLLFLQQQSGYNLRNDDSDEEEKKKEILQKELDKQTAIYSNFNYLMQDDDNFQKMKEIEFESCKEVDHQQALKLYNNYLEYKIITKDLPTKICLLETQEQNLITEIKKIKQDVLINYKDIPDLDTVKHNLEDFMPKYMTENIKQLEMEVLDTNLKKELYIIEHGCLFKFNSGVCKCCFDNETIFKKKQTKQQIELKRDEISKLKNNFLKLFTVHANLQQQIELAEKKHKLEAQLDDLEKKSNLIINEKNEAQKKLKQISKDIDLLILYLHAFRKLQQKTIDSLTNQLSSMNQIESNKKEYKLLQQQFKQATIAADAQKRIVVLKTESKKINNLTEQATDTERLNGEILLMQQKMIHNESLNENKSVLEQEFADRELYEKIINSKDGLPKKIMSLLVQKVELQCNAIFNEICDFHVSIQYSQKGGIEIYVYYSNPNLLIPAQQSGGYQKFIIDIIMRKVFCSLVSVGIPSILFIDEGFDNANEHNFDIICRYVLPKLASQFKKVILISHTVRIHDYTTCHLEVIKNTETNTSRIKFGNTVHSEWLQSNILEKRNHLEKKIKIKKRKAREEDDHKEENDSYFTYLEDANKVQCNKCDKIIHARSLVSHKKSKAHTSS